MEKKKILISTEYIKLGQFLKMLGIISLGSEAKYFLYENNVLVNGKIENRRGRKIYNNYSIQIKEIIFDIEFNIKGKKNE